MPTRCRRPPSGAIAGAENVLSGFATKLADTPGDLAEFGRRFNRAVKQRDWDGYARSLSQLVEKHFAARPKPAIDAGRAEDGDAKQLRDLLSRTLTFAVASLLAGTPALVGRGRIAGRRRQAGPQRRGAGRRSPRA